MTSTLVLKSGPLRCELLPALGGCIVGLWRNEVPVLRYTPADQLQGARQSASYSLVPYSNRIGQGQFEWEGRSYTLPRNMAPEPHSIHGVGFERVWLARDTQAASTLLEYRHGGDASWPFAFDALQTVVLEDDALQLSLQMTNRSDKAAPAGLGWHPFFVKRAGSRIRFASRARWDMGADKLPTRSVDHAGLNQLCDRLTVDHCFDGWDGAVLLQDAVHTLHITSDLDRLVVFTTPERDSIAIEPVSHVNNALALATAAPDPAQALQALGLRVLQSGATLSATLRIQIAPTVATS